MSVHLHDPRPNASQREMEAQQASQPSKKLFSKGKTALGKGMNDLQQVWLLDYCTTRWHSLYQNLRGWRTKMEKFERMADDDYSDRKTPDLEKSNATATIFDRQNHTLGLVSGFADFANAQARDDIFGVKPWLAVSPQGQSDNDLADQMTKHSQWKIGYSNLEACLLDALRISDDLGTCFVKLRWCREEEVTESARHVAHSKSGDAAILTEGGDYIHDAEGLPEGTDGADVEWRELLIENTERVYDNLDAACLDWKTVAFDTTAPELDLRFTDFMVKFRMGVLDLCAYYELTDEQRDELLNLAHGPLNEEVRRHRDESSSADSMKQEKDANPEIELVEGFLRCDPRGTGKPIRIHVIFSPDLHVMFRCDYLTNVTPGGILPVFPVRAFKIPRRIIGRGYFERFEDANTAVDGQYNAVTYRNRQLANVFKFIKRSALRNQLEGTDLIIDPDKLYEIDENANADDILQFKTMPDMNERSVELMNQMLQMAQMRTGITSAAQGELKGVPNANTATGVNQLMSRGATLVKVPIDQQTADLVPLTEFAVFLIYTNQDTDETFTWGEGKDAELVELKHEKVQGMRVNVKLTLTRAQSFSKLESAKAAIDIAQKYAALPEPEKAAQRRLFIQAITALGYNDADQIIRDAVVDPASIGALLPPEMQPVFQQFLETQGLSAPPMEQNPTPDAPVTPVPAA